MDASLLGNLLTGKGAIATSQGRVVNKEGKRIHRAGEGIVRAGKGNNKKFLVPPHPLPHPKFEIQKYYENESKFNGVYSRDNLPNKIKDGAYVINLDEYFDIGTHWVALYVKNNDITYFESFGVEHIPKEIIKFIGYKNVIANIFRIQAYNSIICGYFCIRFINFLFNGKILTKYTNLFPRHDFKKNNNIIMSFFKDK